MSEQRVSFGAGYAALEGVENRATFEAAEGRRDGFGDVDRVLDRLIRGALRGERIASCTEPDGRNEPEQVELAISLSDSERNDVAEHFEVDHQERRGGWYVPENETLSLGLIHAVLWSREVPRFALSAADAERANPPFRGHPQAVATWVLEPLFEQLFLPFRLRSGTWLGNKTAEEQEKQWAIADPLYAALGVDVDALDQFRPKTGWGRLDSQAIADTRQTLFEAIARVPEDVGSRYRAYRIGEVVDRYYAKAKNGRALRKAVLTKPAGRTLTAYFGGDWLAFLRYLGEEPHDGEEIVQALPQTKLMVGTTERAAEVAAAHGLPAAEVQKMLASYWQQSDHSSPLDQRVQVLKRFWDEFDAIHARQESGMPSLWGLVDWGGIVVWEADDGDYRPAQNAALLSPKLKADIYRCWGATMLPKWPDRVVSEPSPSAHLAEAFGPALSFWSETALTAWFLCEGPYSRTDMAGLAEYHRTTLDRLEEMGCPISGDLFRELRAAEKTLKPKPREQDPDDVTEIDVGDGLSFSVSIETSYGNELLEGFETLRDIITRHRRVWATEHLDSYLRRRWEDPLRSAGDTYNRLTAQRSKTPTAKQFAKAGAEAANLWFGGHLAAVYSVLGLKSPDPATEVHLMPDDVPAFMRELQERLGGKPRERTPTLESPEQMGAFRKQQKIDAYASGLARLSLSYIQIEEALGRPPELKEVGRSKFEYQSELLADDTDEAWRTYSNLVQELLREGAAPAIGGQRDLPETEQADTPEAVNASAEVAPENSTTDVSAVSPTTDAEVAAAAPAQVTTELPPAGWYADPGGEHTWRWWDGEQWTSYVG